MRTFLAVTLVMLVMLVAACGGGSGGGASPAPLGVGVHNLGLATFLGQRFDGEWIVAGVPEGDADRNGDGDVNDIVLTVVRARTGQARTLPWAVQSFELGAGCITFVVPEFAQGNRDLDRDGDALDYVLFVHDLRTGATRNLGLAVGAGTPHETRLVAQQGNLLAFAVSETAQGETDLDGDGFANDRVVHVLPLPNGRVQSLGLPTRSLPVISGSRIAIAVAEDGRRDRNGDGDALDQVVLVHDSALGTSLDLGRAVSTWPVPGRMELAGDLLAFPLSEAAQGGVDLDGDGDALDVLLEVHDLATGTSVRTPGPTADFWLTEELVAAALVESEPGATGGHDWNGDGDVLDQVAWFHDRLSDTDLQSGLALPTSNGLHATFAPQAALHRRSSAFLVDEFNQGGVDLNGDGDAGDLVLHFFDGARGAVEATVHEVGWGYEVLELDAEHLVFPRPDARFPDANQAMAMELPAGSARPLGLAVGTRMNLQEGRALVWVPELLQGEDLDGDGRIGSTVLLVHSLVSGNLFNTGLALHFSPPWEARPVLHGDVLVLEVLEWLQIEDLNGDGDKDDSVLQLVRLP